MTPEYNPFASFPAYRTIYFKELFCKANTEIPSNTQLPLRILNTIGKHPVDILTTEISLAYFNNLNYSPRPCFQSYQAYNGFLDSLNAAKYTSSKAPAFLLFTPNSVDGRCDFWDETKTKISICSNYSCIDTFTMFDTTKYLLLKRNINRGEASLKFFRDNDTEVDKDIEIPENKHLLLMKLNLNYSMKGKIKSFLFHPPSLFVVLTKYDGTTISFYTVKSILESGVLVNKNTLGIGGYQSLFSGKPDSLITIKSVKIITREPNCFNKSISGSFYEVIGHASSKAK
ncbi:hypothetical protein, partial [Parasediminibacterium sp. JCM 36343]|uniref:hypothetical protein n=1 Tax=Parasediminibacterium sp. JCM 36343 TaxID=3374279 RepID=UPI003978DB5F